MTANSTETIPGTSIATSWSTARSIVDDTVAANSIGLAACVSESLMDGIRVFYPSQGGWIQMLKYTLGGNGTWIQTDYWTRADTSSGFACAIKNGPNGGGYLNLYLRITETGVVKQYWNNYSDGSDYGFDQTSELLSYASISFMHKKAQADISHLCRRSGELGKLHHSPGVRYCRR